MAALQLVWFKRDLRTVDHSPLVEAPTSSEIKGLSV
jgi:deoxyribodipyrimidine photolyase